MWKFLDSGKGKDSVHMVPSKSEACFLLNASVEELLVIGNRVIYFNYLGGFQFCLLLFP